MPLFLTIIVTWNSGNVLSACLDRRLKQTLQNFEIIVIADSSTNKAVAEMPEKYSNLIYESDIYYQTKYF